MDESPESDIEEYSSMEQPPLIKQLKTILAEYPDDGQIIKELLQNAKDAGASEVKILYDERCINTQEDKRSKYRKFFRGPALCFFNNATFSDSDWLGIKMIYSSVKEEDPLKVGRFGLGFKSIFYITDHPVVLSGDRILFMDPHRSADCVCLTIKLSKLQKWKKLNIEDFLLTLDGTFGVSREILEMGRYDGTLFWFPFRSEASKLSDTIYNREKVMDLFSSFRAEASCMLIFLTNLMKVSLHERKSDSNTVNMQFTLELVKNIDEVRESRKTFLTKIRNLDRYVSESSIDSRYPLSVCTKSFDGDCAVHEITTDWMVTNYYKGGKISGELRKLILDDSLGYRPLVGVAALMGKNAGFKGHVFCFLPLPQKTKSVTGLPVHVNGFFALSQNRRHIKWPSAEQDTMHIHRDKSMLWNEKLLTEVLPDAYEILITEVINHAMKKGNPDDLVQCVYASVPSADKVVDEWNAILLSLSGKIMIIPTLMAVNRTGEKSWISCSEAFFATFCKCINLKQAVKVTIVKVLQMYGKRYVDVPLHVFEFFSKFSDKSTDLNPQSFAAVLKEDSIYMSLSREDKLNVLDFLTQDCQYQFLEGLQLLPLQDCTFDTFISKPTGSDRVLLCSKEDIELFPGLEKKFVYIGHENQWFESHLQVMVKQGLFQIQFMDEENFRTLLEEVTQGHFGSVHPRIVKPFSALAGSWTQRVWEHIFSHKYNIDHFKNMPLIPLLKNGSWSDVQEIEMCQLTDFLIVKQMQDIPSLHDGVYRCMENLSVKVLPSIPLWLQTSEIKQQIHYSTVNGVIELLGRINYCHERQELIDAFNSLCVEEDKKEFASFIAGCTSWKSDSRSLVRCLKIFKNSVSHSWNVSVQENATVITTEKYPVKFHRPFIIGSLEECRLACALGAKEIDRNSLIMETLQMMQGENYSFSEKQMFMQYFIQHIGEFEQDKNMINMASRVAFLESNITHAISKPVDLFDPLDSRLLELFQGENRFPAEKCFRTSSEIVALKKFGLRTYCDVSIIELYETAHVIESWCESERDWHMVHEKAKWFLEILKDKPALLNNHLHEYTLRSKLMDMRCMLHSVTKDPGFPSVLPWFQQQMILSKPSELRLLRFSQLLGSVMPLIDCQSKELAEAFGWNQKPPQDKVLEQFRLLINVYKNRYRPELLPVIKEIYQELNTYSTHNLLADPNFQTLLQSGCIWRGDGFSSPQEIFLESKRNDLDLTPYIYKLPEEFRWLDSFFLKLGCNKEQNIDVLLKTQAMIKEKYELGQNSDDDVRRDLSIVISILNCLRQEKSKIQDRLHEILFPIHCDKNIEVFNQWSILPVKQSDKNTLMLRPINKRFTLLDLWSFDRNCDIRNALEGLNLPQLCTSIFIDGHLSSLMGMLCSLVASKTKPLEFLNCLCYHKDKIKNAQLTPEQCNSILVFFSQQLKELVQEGRKWWIQDQIKALPLHVTQQGTPTSLDGDENVLVLPSDMPTEGLDVWAHNTGHILLQQNKELEELHKLLQCTFASMIDVYSSKILPRLQSIPECHYLRHLWFIKDKLLCKSFNQATFNTGQQKLILILKSTAFIATNDGMKLASEFYDPQQQVFACMCDEDDFPPSPFGDEQWNEFMKHAGLKTQVTETMLVEFAEKLAREGAHCITENIVNKSKTLVEYLWHTCILSWETSMIRRLSRVKFIAPHVVSSKFSSLYKQYSESERLICFSESIAASFESLCWTSMNLLPKWACPESEKMDEIWQIMGVQVKPPVDRVVAHCQNIFDVQKNSFVNKVYEKSWFKNLVDNIYAYLSNHRNEDPRLKEKLEHTPIVFLPENKLLLPARKIVIELKKEEMVEPYLYMASEYYQRHKDFFIFLGASKKVTLCHYFRVLESVYQKQTDHDKRLLPPELRIVRKAIKNIVELLISRSAKQTNLNIGTLYLPDKSERLKDARCLIVADKVPFEKRLLQYKLEYFIGFREIRLDVPDPRPVIKALPDCCRPKLLSEVVKEQVDMTQMIEVVSDVAVNLEHFFHSIEFVQGILRLVKHEKTQNDQTFTNEDAEKIYGSIQNSKITQVEGLSTFLYINEERIESSKWSKAWFVNEKLNENRLNFTLYFQVHENKERNVENNMIVRHNGVIGLIQRCINNSVQNRTDMLYAIVDCLHDRYQINNILDMFDIDPYDLPQNIPCSIFPCPGTYVPEEFHAFLEQGFSEFEQHEFDSVAYELEDDLNHLDTDASVFIYVRIIKMVESTEPSETGITTRYEIDIGDPERGHIIVSAYNLFKFERKEVSRSKELLSSNSVTSGTLPADHTCCIIRNILREAWALSKEERQKILRRLLLRWHPDKNIGQEDYCRKIFIYIKEVVSRLDDGTSLDDENINFTNNAGSSSFTGTEYENLGRRVNRMSAQYSEQYSRHENVYYETHSRGHQTCRSSYFPIPDIHNARRWIQQAKKDLSSAKTFHHSAGDVPAFNWICYMCHQATEKALKAAIYAKDANRVDLQSHKLASIASNGELSSDCVQIVRDLECCLQEHTRMRYPDSVSRRQIPADIYTDVQASTALEIAERLIVLVDQNYIN